MIYLPLLFLIPAAIILCGAVKRYGWFVRREHLLMNIFVVLCALTTLHSCSLAVAS